MEILIQLLKALLNLFLVFVILLGVYFIVKTFIVVFKVKSKSHHSFKRHMKHCLWHIRDSRYIKPVEFVKWCLIDTFRGKDRLRLWGIWAFVGYYGDGKTMGCVQFAKQLQRDYPHRNIKIFSNIYISGQVRRIEDWEELLHLPPNSIFIYDESQADWSCNIGVNSFPEDFLRRITQVRKKQFAMFMTSPKFNRMNINLRESVNFVIECKNFFQMDRWFKYVFYRAEDYENYHENKLKLAMNKYLSLNFVITDRDYRQYNTVEEVETIKKEDVKLKKNDQVMISNYLKSFRNEILKEVSLKLKNII